MRTNSQLGRLVDDPMMPLVNGPESLNLSDLGRFLSWTPLIGPQARLFRRYRAQLKRRDPAICRSRWSQDTETLRILKIVSGALEEYVGWPTDRLLPEDRFAALCWDPLGDLADAEVLLAIERGLGLSDEARIECFLDGNATLGDVVQSLKEMLTAPVGAGAR